LPDLNKRGRQTERSWIAFDAAGPGRAFASDPLVSSLAFFLHYSELAHASP
jgi:hypothetical protein